MAFTSLEEFENTIELLGLFFNLIKKGWSLRKKIVLFTEYKIKKIILHR